MFPNIPFTTSSKEFDTQHDVVNWIIDNQLSRRNLEPEQYSHSREKRHVGEKKETFRPKIDLKSDNVADLGSANNETSLKIKLNKTTII